MALAMADDLAARYDAVPYDSEFHAQTHPDRLAAIAVALGLAPAPPRTCRVLEIGCAGGGNVVPIAQALPGARVVGIDLSPVQVGQGRALADRLGLANLDLRAMSVLDVDDGLGRFDYILCHGVYSWVPPEVQAKILDVCARNLAPGGVAYVSYNTYPGWHLRGMAREMMLYHADEFDEPGERAGQARAALEFLAGSALAPDGAAARALRDEAELLRGKPDSYLLHEHLAPFNRPCYFHEFAERAARAGLRHLTRAGLHGADELKLAPEARAQLGSIADPIRREQYLDFLVNRTFRRDLLVAADARPAPHPSVDSLRRLRFSVMCDPLPVEPGAPPRFHSFCGHDMETAHPVNAAVLHHLASTWPHTASFAELTAAVAERTAVEPSPRALAEALIQCQLTDMLQFHASPPDFRPEPGPRPLATPLSRLLAGTAEAPINAYLLRVFLDPFARAVLRHLDGHHDRPALLSALESEGVAPPEGATTLAEALEPTLRHIAREALLVG